nr:SH3 domain-containing protein [Intestinimonas butyriciproducens]
MDAIARNLVESLCQYFGIPFLEPRPARQAVVDVEWGALNIRSRPDRSAPIVARAYDGARLTVLNQWQGWYLVRFDGVVGYASSEYITLV